MDLKSGPLKIPEKTNSFIRDPYVLNHLMIQLVVFEHFISITSEARAARPKSTTPEYLSFIN